MTNTITDIVEQSYIITPNHLPLRDRVNFLKRRGIDRDRRREVIESPELSSQLYPLSLEENKIYEKIRLQQEEGRKIDDQVYLAFSRLILGVSTITGVCYAIQTGQLKWAATGFGIGLASAIGLQVFRTISDYGKKMFSEDELY